MVSEKHKKAKNISRTKKKCPDFELNTLTSPNLNALVKILDEIKTPVKIT